MSISADQQKKIQDYCFDEPRTIGQIAKKILLDTKNALKSLYNYFTTKKAKTLFFIKNSDGFVWIRTNPLFFNRSRLDLINVDKQNEQKTRTAPKTDSSKTYQKLEGLVRSSPERNKAALILNRINKFGQYNKEEKEFVYTNTAKTEIDELFKAYCTRVRNEKIIMTRSAGADPIFSHDIKMPYKTRFTSYDRQQENINGFKSAYLKSSRRHLKGVFLTLTIQPIPQETLWQANRRGLKAWGKMHKFISKILPDRCSWICIREFQQNGRIHFHIMITGVNWLAHKSLISYTWQKYGGGKILDIHTIRQDPGQGWVWARSCPLESSGKQPQSYLESYLEKSMSINHGAMYWATGIRNWTCSKNLLPEKLPAGKKQEKKYTLKGVLSYLSGFRASHRKDTMSLFAASKSLDNSGESKHSNPKKITEPVRSLTFQKATELYLKQTHNMEE